MSEISSAELAEWMAFERIEPFGELVADLRHGIATSVLANVNRDSKKRSNPYLPEDFIYWHPKHQEAERPQFVANPQRQSALVTTALFRKVKKPRR